jgi:hypothetical protein
MIPDGIGGPATKASRNRITRHCHKANNANEMATRKRVAGGKAPHNITGKETFQNCLKKKKQLDETKTKDPA